MKGRTFSDQYLSICELRNIDIVNFFPLQSDILVVCGRGRHRLSKSQQCSSHLAFVQTKNRIATEYELILRPIYFKCILRMHEQTATVMFYTVFLLQMLFICYLFISHLFVLFLSKCKFVCKLNSPHMLK